MNAAPSGTKQLACLALIHHSKHSPPPHHHHHPYHQHTVTAVCTVYKVHCRYSSDDPACTILHTWPLLSYRMWFASRCEHHHLHVPLQLHTSPTWISITIPTTVAGSKRWIFAHQPIQRPTAASGSRCLSSLTFSGATREG